MTESQAHAESRGDRVAVVTGASAGIGAATVRALTAAGWRVYAGARRLDKLREVTGAAGAEALELDVADDASCTAFVERLPERVHLLVNNAGVAHGLDSIAQADVDGWRRMYEVNVLGVLRLTRALLPRLVASGDGLVVNIGSIAGFETYRGGGGYTATKHALRALTRTLRVELLGQPVRVTEIAPGMVETEFSVVRFHGDSERADSVYQGMQPLVGDDIAECVVWVAERPPHVNIDEMVVRPRDQATATEVHRRS